MSQTGRSARTARVEHPKRGWLRLLALLVALGVLSCDSGNFPDPMSPEVPGPVLDRIDATGGEGDPHFYFMPPVAPQLFPYRGVFERRAGRDLKAILTVDGAPQPPYLPFIRPRKNLNKEFYELHWPAPADAYEARVEVWLADKPMGSLDLRAAETPQEIRAVKAVGYAPFTPGRVTQIRMRVEVGAGEGYFPDRPRMADGRPTGDTRVVFKPPVSRDRAEFAAFDPTVLGDLVVEVWAIEEEGPGRPGTLRVVKRFDGSSSAPSDRVVLNERKEFYQAIWSTRGVEPWIDHRAKVLLDGVELGWVDIDVVPLDLRGPNWPDELGFLERARRTGAYAVLEGMEAFIRFRVERGLTPASGRIVFESYQDDTGSEIYVMDSDGTGGTRLTDTPGRNVEPRWSPDGSRIAFRSSRDGGEDEIYVMYADGSGQMNLTNDPGREAHHAWSPDGQRVAFSRTFGGNRSDIYVVSLDGSEAVNLTDHPGFDQRPDWSPDGTRIAFSGSRDGSVDLYVMNADGSGLVRLTETELPGTSQEPRWSPDGKRIAFRRADPGPQLIDRIYVMNADGTGQTRLTLDAAADYQWSPDGSKIVFTSWRDGNPEIYVMNADGSAHTRLTHLPERYDFLPHWSPDGTGITFMSQDATSPIGKLDIFVMSADGTNLLKLTDEPGHHRAPRWSPRPPRM